MRSTIVNDKMEVTQRDDQIFNYVAINNCTLDMETMKKVTEIGDTWNEEKLCANLFDIRDMMFIDSKTRNYAAEQYRPHVAASAIVVESRMSSYFANLYLKFSTPKIPTRLFTKMDEAEKWLKKKMQEKR